MKDQHEKWVRESLDVFDEAKQRDDEVYADYVEEWATRVKLENWRAWSTWVLGGGQPSMPADFDRQLEECRVWLLSRIWAKRYHELEAAFENFGRVLEAFQSVFRRHARPRGEGGETLVTHKFYQIPQWDPALYERLGREFDFHVALVEDLMLELTRATNHVCDRVREFISPSFRLREGAVVTEGGLYLDMTYKVYRPEYRGHERTLCPFPGLEQFKVDRKTRDFHFGEGAGPDDRSFRVGQ